MMFIKLAAFKPLLFCFFLCLCNVAIAQQSRSTSISSPDKKVKVSFSLSSEGEPMYRVFYEGETLLSNSPMGLIREDGGFYRQMRLIKTSPVEKVQDNYSLLHGKKRAMRYQGNRISFALQNPGGKKMNIQFQVSNDGVAFRYQFPETSTDIKKITEEKTAYNFQPTTTAWIQPMSEAQTGWEHVNPCYEENYYKDILLDSLPASKPGWVYPALFNYKKYWLALTESGPDKTWCGTRLLQSGNKKIFTIGFPDKREVFTGGDIYPISKLPWTSPWRIIVVGNKLSSIVESNLGTDLATPAKKGDYSFVKPGRSSWSWISLKDDSVVYSVQKRFIDYAADMRWEYCLVDADWNKRIGHEKIGELAAYAKSKGIGLLVWYNSAGDWNTTPYGPRSKLLTHEDRIKEFAWLQKIGVKGVKIDFFAGDGQSMIRYYHEILEDALPYKLLINFHGATLPRGWHRTYPHMLSAEAVRGFENVTFNQRDADEQPAMCATLPFTRNLFDPMDYTPMTFSTPFRHKRRTSSAFELALPFIFHSGIQHLAETPEGMAKVPAYVKELAGKAAVSWDDTKFIDGYPGKYIVVAKRKGNTWYVTGINGTKEEMTLQLPLSFIKAKNGSLVTDGSTDRSFEQRQILLSDTITIKPAGGFVIEVR